ncbi:DNA-3-methyladenine glycosylase I [Halieaceae bacterium IMCC14734]|uniref:DNA-3-methyladenine glycosylase I n=1 Tax=Candidatus Litorirhabdus singularis TaxID=2518993 RepID=A0ABT3TNF0_9GAMM|nr:DNA-3-methyladenine glycosylase I [Candidatus Litorirhabdus singularis]MCX2983266.1 DNA-3-methyladenine glycosylase I [Candidatus Litorirhabdus singularis]
MPKRCQWCGDDDLYQRYHDEEWGVPCRNDAELFEFLILEGAQAGLAWITVLRKREGYRALFDGFDVNKVARYTDAQLDRLLQNPAIIRNRLKVYSARQNARAFLKLQNEFGSFSDYIWAYVDHKPLQNRFTSMADMPASTELSDRISKDLKKRGFNFVGSTIMYAYLQACGLVNDHTIECYRHRACKKLAQ